MKRTARERVTQMAGLSMGAAVWLLAMSLVGKTATPVEATLMPLLSKDLAHVEGKEVSMFTVDYPPGATDPVHTHPGQAFVYVLDGSIVMQVEGGTPVTLTAGQTFYEGPGDVHVVGRNASETVPARFLVFMVKDKAAPILTLRPGPAGRR